MMKKSVLAGLISITLTSSFAQAASSDKLSGDWGGTRSELKDKGVDLFLYYDSIAAANISGGIESDEKYTGQVYAGAHFTFSDGLEARLTTVNRHGNSISPSVGGIYDPMTIYGGQVTYLYQAWLEQTWNNNGDIWALKGGRVSADTDFANSDMFRYSSSTSVNGPSRPMLLENSITSFPYSVWGARLKNQPSDELMFQIGVYQIGEDMWDYTEHGLNFDIDGDDGWTVMLQSDWTPNLKYGKARFYIGVAQSYYDFDHFDGVGTSDDFTRIYSYGEIKTSENVTLFGAFTYGFDDDVAKTPMQINLGVNALAMFESRPNDRTFAHFTYGEISDEYGDSMSQDLDYESVFEVGHRVQINPAFYIQPAVQYISNPGGSGDIDDALVVGMWFGAAI